MLPFNFPLLSSLLQTTIQTAKTEHAAKTEVGDHECTWLLLGLLLVGYALIEMSVLVATYVLQRACKAGYAMQAVGFLDTAIAVALTGAFIETDRGESRRLVETSMQCLKRPNCSEGN